MGAAIYLLVIDLRRGKDTRRILADLNECFPDTEGPVAGDVREALGAANHELHLRARGAVEAGDGPMLGALMTEAQERFDAMVAPACPELESPRLHEVLAHPAIGELAHGAKGVGSQGDGCAQIVAQGSEQREVLSRKLTDDFGVRAYGLTLEPGPRP